MKNKPILMCKLCLKNPAIENSHIISKFLNKPLRKNRDMLCSSPKHKKPEKVQDLWKEPLLCRDCDNRVIGQYEQYASQILFHTSPKRVPDPIDNQYEIITSIDYKKMKLFTMSLIWRMGVSNIPDFSHVRLGPHEEKLRRMIYDGEPGKYYEYGCILGKIEYEGGSLLISMPPEVQKKENHHIYSIVVCSNVFTFVISSHSSQNKYRDEFLRESGLWRVKSMDENHPFVEYQIKRAHARVPNSVLETAT